MARAIKISSVSGALTVTITGPNGGTPVVYADSSFSSVQSMPATVADTATTTFWLQGPGKYTLSVKTSGGTEIAADNNSTRTVDVETDGTVAALNYDARTLATVSGDSGHSTAGSAASGVTVQDEGTPLATAATTVNFVGAGVTATGTGATKTITIPGVPTVAVSGDTTGATDTTAIQAAINAAAAAGGGVVQLGVAPPSAPYYVTTLQLKTGVELVGQGRLATILRVPLGQAANATVISLFDGTVNTWALRRFSIDGQEGAGLAYSGGTTNQQTNQFTGILISAPAASNHFTPFNQDMVGEIDDVSVFQCSQHGVWISNNASETRLRDVYAISNRQLGIYLEVAAHDVFVENCTAGANGSGGFFVYGQDNMLTNCKAWWNGWKAQFNSQWCNFAFNAKGIVGTGLYSQDAYHVGYSFGASCLGCKVDGISAGSGNGAVDGDVEVFNSQDCKIDINISGSVNNVASTRILSFDGTTAIGNDIKINGQPSNTPVWLAGTQSAVGNRVQLWRQGKSQSVAYGASITPDPYAGDTVLVGTLTGAITINNPSRGHAGSTLTLQLTQDATGRVVTFGANYKTTGAISTTASSVTTITFLYDGTNWRETTRAVT